MNYEYYLRLCALCRLEEKTTVFRRTAAYTILNCSTCKSPMMVLKEHRTDPLDGVLREGLFDLALVANRYHGRGRWYYDDSMRTIPDHYHIHARKK